MKTRATRWYLGISILAGLVATTSVWASVETPGILADEIQLAYDPELDLDPAAEAPLGAMSDQEAADLARVSSEWRANRSPAVVTAESSDSE